MSINNLVEFFETNGITTVYDVHQDNLFIAPPPKGSRLRAVLTSLPEQFLRNISEEDRTKNMQELTKIRDSMTPEALSALHSAHFSNAISFGECQKALMVFEEAEILIVRNALNSPYAGLSTAIVPPNAEPRHLYQYIHLLYKYYDCLIKDIENQQEIHEPLEATIKKNEIRWKKEEIRRKKEEERKEEERKVKVNKQKTEFYDCQAAPDEFLFPVFQNDELVRSDEISK
jgi:hypothetical protein